MPLSGQENAGSSSSSSSGSSAAPVSRFWARSSSSSSGDDSIAFGGSSASQGGNDADAIDSPYSAKSCCSDALSPASSPNRRSSGTSDLSAMSSRFTSRRSSRIDQDQDNQEDGKRRVKFAEQHATIVNEEQVPMTRAMAKRVKQMQPKADTIYVYEQVVVSDRELDAAFGPGETAHERMLALEAQRRTGGGRFLDAANTDMPARKTDATSAINKIK
eukprot:GEMP01080498.1.p1 GENE.GEMP01080498.1~~GEMP01080498.1.p1  ORF type:complete len:217 (+),score=41.84 GEMP01080498.1:134-784(+)